MKSCVGWHQHLTHVWLMRESPDLPVPMRIITRWCPMMPNVGVKEDDHCHSSSIPTLCPTISQLATPTRLWDWTKLTLGNRRHMKKPNAGDGGLQLTMCCEHGTSLYFFLATWISRKIAGSIFQKDQQLWQCFGMVVWNTGEFEGTERIWQIDPSTFKLPSCPCSQISKGRKATQHARLATLCDPAKTAKSGQGSNSTHAATANSWCVSSCRGGREFNGGRLNFQSLSANAAFGMERKVQDSELLENVWNWWITGDGFNETDRIQELLV